MRIIAGESRGQIIAAPEGMKTRPTQDKVREAIFGMLQFDIPSSRVLDLFSGSGAMGLEALSRGAEYAIFNDSVKASVNVIKSNIIKLGYQERSRVLNMDCAVAIKALASSNDKFDFVFVDPPYHSGIYEEVLSAIHINGLLAHNGAIIAERQCDIEIMPVAGLIMSKSKKYGRTVIEVFHE